MFNRLSARYLQGAGFRATANVLAARSAWLAWALCVVAGIAVLDDYGVATDEDWQRSLAMATLDYVLGRNEVLLQHADRAYGVAFEAFLAVAERLLDLQDSRAIYLWRHLLTHLGFLSAGLAAAGLAFRLYGSRCLALCAFGLFLLHPRLYAHSFFNSKDIPFLSLFMVALYLLERAFRQGTVAAFLLGGAGVGLLTNIRPMGILLFAGALALRACDCVQAADRSARRQVLRTSGLFVLASAAALYATWPYVWNDTARRLGEAFAYLAEAHTLNTFPFQGRSISSTAAPPDYVPTWFAITAPPAALLLGVIGAAVILQRGCARPRALLRHTRLRFGFLLLACLVLPVLAAILLGTNIYDDWRHMYFLYAPFCLVAVAGLDALRAAARRGWTRGGAVGAYGLAGAGATAALAAMISLHPHQHLYFNLLVNRATPEHLRSQYELEYWQTSYRQALGFLLARYPAQPIRVRPVKNLYANRKMLSAAERRRIVFVGDEYADFHILHYHAPGNAGQMPEEAYAPVVYTHSAYGNTIFTVAAVNLDRVEADAAAPYRATYRALAAATPVVRDRFDVYLDARAVRYVRAPCRLSDLRAKFVLHVTPVDPREAAGRSLDNLAFYFHRRGARFDGQCLAAVPLPAYPIRHLQVGQWVGRDDRMLWLADIPIPPDLDAYRTAYRALAADPPALQAAFDVYVTADAVAYAKTPCTAADTQPKFILHVIPSRARDLPPARRRLGFDNRDFQFAWQGAHFDDRCLALAALPTYPVARLRVGQFRAGESPLWAAEIPLPR